MGRINGAVGTLDSVPIHYLHRSVTPEQLTALYCAADVMLVTPLRDGMNLVAKEYVASRADEDGVLLLSEFAGAAEELGEAVIVNPTTRTGWPTAWRTPWRWARPSAPPACARCAAACWRATSTTGRSGFLAARRPRRPSRADGPERLTDPHEIEGLMRRVTSAARVVLVLDYDGTLVGLREMPELAAPDAVAARACSPCSRRPATCTWRAGGRARWWTAGSATCRSACGPSTACGIGRRRGSRGRSAPTCPPTGCPEIRARMEEFVARAPGARARGEVGVARLALPPGRAGAPARCRPPRCSASSSSWLAGRPLEVIEGHKVIEVRQAAVDKGTVVREVVARAPRGRAASSRSATTAPTRTCSRRCRPDGVAIRVGAGDSSAPYRLDSPTAVRALLGALT